jgi:hypothetical protein
MDPLFMGQCETDYNFFHIRKAIQIFCFFVIGSRDIKKQGTFQKNNAMIQYIVELAVHVTYGFLDSEPEQDSNHAKLEI